MNALDVLCAQLTRDLFAIAKFLLTITRLLLHCWYSLGRHVTTGTPVVIFVLFWLCFYCFWRLVHRWYTVCTVLVDLWRFVHQCFWVFLTIGTMNHSSKTVKRQSNSKNDHWCTNRHMSTQRPPNTQSRANAPTLQNLHHMCLGSGHSPSPVGRADSMCLHGRPCVWLPFAAACCYTLSYLQMMPAARLVCQQPSSNFQYFWTPLANFLLYCPNSVEYGNSKTTTLLPSAKCTRPLFQGQTDCGGRPSGWHDIVTCQHLVYFKITSF